MAESRLSFSSLKVTKHSASTRLITQLLALLLNEFIFNNSAADTWFGTFLLQRYELHFLSSGMSFFYCAGLCCTSWRLIASHWKINMCAVDCILLNSFSQSALSHPTCPHLGPSMLGGKLWRSKNFTKLSLYETFETRSLFRLAVKVKQYFEFSSLLVKRNLNDNDISAIVHSTAYFKRR